MPFTEAGLQQIRTALGAPRTLHYLYSTSTEAWFGDLDPRQAIARVDVLAWRGAGRPMTMEFTIG
jgi:hypothetical protein